MLSLQLATQLLYRQDESLYHTATKQKRSVVKVLSTLLCLPGFETQTQNKERPVRGYILQKGEQREGQGEGPRTGGPRTAETWFVSRHYDLRASLEGVHTQ
jgi:hypothetical protein